MKKERVTKCAVYYVLQGDTRVRTFASEESMERWVIKFNRENPDRDESWIDVVITGYKTLNVKSRGVTLVGWGN